MNYFSALALQRQHVEIEDAQERVGLAFDPRRLSSCGPPARCAGEC